MKHHLLLFTLGLLITLTACKAQTTNTKEENPLVRSTESAITISTATKEPANGNQIVSTDPATFSRASGQLQLVEFFSFT